MKMAIILTDILEISSWEVLWGKFITFLPTLLAAIIILIVGIIITKIANKIMSKALKRSRLDVSAHSFLISLVKIILNTLIIVIALTTLGVPTASMVAVIGAAGLAVGLALQNSLSNLAGGFIILFSKPFVAGDFIESNGASGTVDSINILYTRLLTADNKAVFIPNGQVSNSKIINYTQEKLRRLELSFGISYKNDYEKAMDIIKEIISDNEFAIRSPEPLVRVGDQSANGINIVVNVWVASENYLKLKFDLLEQVKKAFYDSGIKFPYNQINMNTD